MCIYIYISIGYIHIHCINHYINHWMDWAPKSCQKEDQIRIHPGTKHSSQGVKAQHQKMVIQKCHVE